MEREKETKTETDRGRKAAILLLKKVTKNTITRAEYERIQSAGGSGNFEIWQT